MDNFALVPIPNVPKLFVQPMTDKAREAWNEFSTREDKASDLLTYATLAVLTVCDSSGKLVFKEGRQYSLIHTCNRKYLKCLYDAACKANGL